MKLFSCILVHETQSLQTFLKEPLKVNWNYLRNLLHLVTRIHENVLCHPRKTDFHIDFIAFPRDAFAPFAAHDEWERKSVVKRRRIIKLTYSGIIVNGGMKCRTQSLPVAWIAVENRVAASDSWEFMGYVTLYHYYGNSRFVHKFPPRSSSLHPSMLAEGELKWIHSTYKLISVCWCQD